MAKIAIFDKDGVIINSGRLHYEKWKQTLAKYNKAIEYDFYKKHVAGRSAKDNIEKNFPSLSKEDVTHVLAEQVDFLNTMFDKYVTLVPGVVQFLKQLKAHRFIIGMATSSRIGSTNLMLDKFSLRSYFKTVVTAEDVSHGKPDPAIYLKVAKKLHVETKDCVVFEDSFFGVKAAKKAGMKVVLVMTSHTREEIPSVDMSIKDFTTINVKDVEMI